jgi:hypothetical protein
MPSLYTVNPQKPAPGWMCYSYIPHSRVGGGEGGRGGEGGAGPGHRCVPLELGHRGPPASRQYLHRLSPLKETPEQQRLLAGTAYLGAAEQGQWGACSSFLRLSKGVGWAVTERQMGPHPEPHSQFLHLCWDSLSIGSHWEARSPKEVQGVSSAARTLQGAGVAKRGDPLTSTHPTGNFRHGEMKLGMSILATCHPARSSSGPIPGSHSYATTPKRLSMTCCLLFKKCC